MCKKRITILLSILISVSSLVGCNRGFGTKSYESALEELQQIDIEKDGTCKVTEELIIALEKAEFTEPKNIIYMIGDGMGANIIQATQEEYADKLYGNQLAINYLPKIGTQSTYSADAKITDSAAGGTALATGYKTSNDTISMDLEHQENYQTVLELAAEKGKSTGIVVTKSVTDATPATFTAHVEDRDMQEEIANQQLEKLADGSLDLVLGGGYDYYEQSMNAEILKAAEASGMQYCTSWRKATKGKLPMAGLFAEKAIDTSKKSAPTLAEMTDLALDLLSEDEKGFFLMVEGSQIDTKAHDNLLEEEMHEMYHFDAAIAVAMKFVALNPDTVLIITADHETGGLYLPKEGYKDNEKYIYLSESHTSINVPVYGIGYGTDALGGIMENTDVAEFVASLLGADHFGQESEVHEVYDADAAKPIKLSFDENVNGHEVLTDDMRAKMSEIQHARAIHMTVQNVGKEKVTLPALKLTNHSHSVYGMVSEYTYIEKGETLELTYVLPEEVWEENALSDVKSMEICYKIVTENMWKSIFKYDAEVAELKIMDISVTERILEK